MRWVPVWALLLALGGAGMGLSGAAMTAEDPFSGEDYDFFSLHTLRIATPVGEYDNVAEAVRRLAEANGYKFRVASPTGRPESIIMDMWTRDIVVTGGSAPDPDELRFAVYWNGDVANDAALDQVAERLRAHLAPFGPVRIVTAPPGTVPRKK